MTKSEFYGIADSSLLKNYSFLVPVLEDLSQQAGDLLQKEEWPDIRALLQGSRSGESSTYLKEISSLFGGSISDTSALFQYFLTLGPVYLEYFNNGRWEKVLGTKTSDLAREWAVIKGQVDEDRLGLVEENIYLLRLEADKQGNRKVAKPRKDYTFDEQTKFIPVRVLAQILTILADKLQQGVVRIVFRKDNGSLRTLDTTLNANLLQAIYGSAYTQRVLEDSWNPYVNTGNILETVPNLARGYLRLPEVGCSRYESGVSACNFLRVEKIKYNIQPDLSLIDYDLSLVSREFENSLSGIASLGLMRELVDSIRCAGLGVTLNKEVMTYSELVDWENDSRMFVGRTFDRSLCLFMLSRPDLFMNINLCNQEQILPEEKINLASSGFIPVGDDDLDIL